MDSVYTKWLLACEELKEAKAYELELRNKICEEVLQDKLEGSKTTRYEHLKITATAKLNRTVDRAVLENIWDDLSDEERECIDYKPSLKLANYKKIEQTGGLLLDAVVVKPGQASLKIVEE